MRVPYDSQANSTPEATCMLAGAARAGGQHGRESLRAYDLGDYTVSFGLDRSSASDWVEIGMRLRGGSFVR